MEDSTLPLPSHAQIFATAAKALRKSPCFLVTNSPTGPPSARLVGTLPIAPDFAFSREPEGHDEDDDGVAHRAGDKLEFKITTSFHTRKVAELKANPFATFAFHDPETVTQVICRGRLVEMVTNPEGLKAFWQKRYEIMFTELGAPRDEKQREDFQHHFVILRFQIMSVEVMGLATTPPIADHWMGWRPVILSYNGSGWKVDRRNLRRFWMDERKRATSKL